MFHTIDLAQATCTLRYNLGQMFVKTKARVHDDPQMKVVYIISFFHVLLAREKFFLIRIHALAPSKRYSVTRNRRLYERKRGPSFLYFCLVHLTTVFSKEQWKVFSSLGAGCDMVIFSEDENHSKNSSRGKWMNFLNFPPKLCAVLI